MRRHHLTVLLLALNALLLCGFAMLRYPAADAIALRQQWDNGTYQGNAVQSVRLYMSLIHDEAYYYEWGTLVLGKTFEDDYPIAARIYSPLRARLGEDARVRRPYLEIDFEYPPLMMVPILTARQLSHDYLSFTHWLAALIGLTYFLGLGVAYRIWRRTPESDRLPWNGVLALSAVALFGLGQIYLTRLDVFASFIYLLAVWMFLSERYALSAICVVLGYFTKGYALLLAPLFGIFLVQRRQYGILLRSIGLVIALLLLGQGILMWWGGANYGASYSYHAERGIQIESLYALIPFIAHLIADVPIRIFESHNSTEISMPGISYLIRISPILMGMALLCVYAMAWRCGRVSDRAVGGLGSLLRGSLLLVMSFMLTFKVLSPQFFVWLTPLIFLSPPRRRTLFFLMLITVFVLTQLIFPALYWMLEEARPTGIVMLVLRNGLFATIAVWLAVDWWRSASREVV